MCFSFRFLCNSSRMVAYGIILSYLWLFLSKGFDSDYSAKVLFENLSLFGGLLVSVLLFWLWFSAMFLERCLQFFEIEYLGTMGLIAYVYLISECSVFFCFYSISGSGWTLMMGGSQVRGCSAARRRGGVGDFSLRKRGSEG